MKKVSLVVFEKERTSALEKLRDTGVVHLEKRGVVTEDLSRLMDQRNRAETALGMLSPYVDKKRKKSAPASAPAGRDGGEAVKNALALAEEQKSLQEQIAVWGRELSRLEKWGDFDPQGLAALAERGVRLVPYELSPAAYGALPPEREVILLSRDKTWVRFLVKDGELEGESPFALPEKSARAITADVSRAKERLAAIDAGLAALAEDRAAIAGMLKGLAERIDFEAARADMETLDDAGERTVSWLTGFVPREDLGVLKRVSAENGWALLADDPGEEDNVPTKLKNNGFVSLINPLTEFLEVLPGYREVDISLFFLCFFVVFFGMIFGDAGYGALLLLAGFFAFIKTAKKGVPGVVKLLLLLGLSNFAWGVLTCSWFGMDTALVPAALKRLSLPLISSASDLDPKLVQQNLMIFCFSLALLQLSIGHVLAMIHSKSLKALGDLGSIAMLAGMYCIILNLIASNDARQIPLFEPAIPVFAGGFVFSFVFSNYEGSVGRSILEILKNIISVILGIANVFSDIMSYIRLWAVGLAGAAIASTVNAMAGPMLGHFLFFVFGVALLAFGHGLNLVLNALSVLVHGVRLNTLEFSGHVGLTWAGFAYKPFAKQAAR
jgi:V/A-type H+-transporting ATPase subunit I